MCRRTHTDITIVPMLPEEGESPNATTGGEVLHPLCTATVANGLYFVV